MPAIFRWEGANSEALFTELPLAYLRDLRAAAVAEDEAVIVEADGDSSEALLAAFLSTLLDQYRDYRLAPARIEMVRLLPQRVGTHVFGAYVPVRDQTASVPLSVEAEDVTIRHHERAVEVMIRMP